MLFGVFDTVMPSYAAAGTSRRTLDDAEQRLGRTLCPISVETFKGTGIMKIKARCTKPRLAQLSADAATRALLDRVRQNQVGIPSLKLLELDPPALPTTPVFPRTRLTLFVALLLGLGLGLGAALLRENLTTKVETADDLASASGAPVFAEIPEESAILKMHSPEALATNPRLRVVAEALRDLRTNLLFTERASARSSSRVPTAATARRPSPSRSRRRSRAREPRRSSSTATCAAAGSPRCSMSRARQGCWRSCSPRSSSKDAIRPTRDSLDILPGGRRSADPAELLTHAFPATLQRSSGSTRRSSSTPRRSIPISDARIVARYADATLLVARAGTATRRQVRAAVERLALISVKPTAVVLNHSTVVSRS